MICFSQCKNALALRHVWPGLAILVIAGCGMSDSASANREAVVEYTVHYTITPVRGSSTVRVELRLE